MINKNGFIPTEVITDPQRLIGRNKSGRELDKLLKSIVESDCNPQLIAERRSGKTSLLNCAICKIEENNNWSNIIPILINFKLHHDVIGVNKGYHLISSYILNRCSDLPVWNNNHILEIRNTRIKFKSNQDEYYNFLIEGNWSSEKFFKDLIFKLSKFGYSTLLFIDEYESMYFSTFQGRIGSVHTIRDLTMSKLESNQQFHCAIAGARPWHFYSQDIGSDDFNFIDDYLFLQPLTDDECFDLFKEGVTLSSGKMYNKLQVWESKINNIVALSGGWPYLIKIIGNDYSQNGSISIESLQNRLVSHFSNIWHRLPSDYKNELKGKGESKICQGNLINWGLSIKKKRLFSEYLVPRGTLWRDFIRANSHIRKGEDSTQKLNYFKPESFSCNYSINMHIFEIQQLGSEVTDKVTEINEVLKVKNLPIIFDTTLSLNYPQQFKNISVLSQNEDQFKVFIASLYIIVFESTQKVVENKKTGKKVTVNMGRYPSVFNRSPKPNEPDIFHHIDVLRHKFLKAHDTLSNNFNTRRFTPEQSQEKYLGHRNRPTINEFYFLQKGLLKDFSSFLSDLLKWANNRSPSI